MIVRILAVLAVLSVAAAVASGWFWWNSSTSDFATERDTVLSDGQRYAVDLNTVDYHSPDFDRWRNAATGALLDRLNRNQENDRANAIANKTVSTARVVTAAVTNLNSHSGSATMIAALEITLSQGGAQATPKISRLDMDLQRTDAGWKVSGLEVVGT